MRASSFADLVNMAASLRITDDHLDLAGASASVPMHWQYLGAIGSAWGSGSTDQSPKRLFDVQTNGAK